jgi:hypothetical protein
VKPTFVAAFVCVASTVHAAPRDYFAIHVVDGATGRGVPLVRLTTTDETERYTDSNGYVAFDEPGWMDQNVFFGVGSWGYDAPDAGFGIRGVTLKTTPGTEQTIKLTRRNVAERLYRITGAGIERDSVLLGKPTTIAQPLVNARITGQDTVEMAVYKGKCYWFFGDTDSAGQPLGLFRTSGATSASPDQLDPSKGIDLTYFVDPKSGFSRAAIEVKNKDPLPCWIDAVMVAKDKGGAERMFCHWVVVDHTMTPIESGMATWNDQRQVFEQTSTLPLKGTPTPTGQPFLAQDAKGTRYYYFVEPSAFVRVPATAESIVDPTAYESFTCLKGDSDEIDRDAAGQVRWQWRRGVKPLSGGAIKKLVDAGKLKRDQSPLQLRDVETGDRFDVAHGSIAWNARLKHWTLLCGRAGGDSLLGEIYFAVASSPEGPWTDARRVATHAMEKAKYDFYNPIQHPEFAARDGGRYVYFQGTFVNTFSGFPYAVPRYNYNQLMYRIDLTDERLSFKEPPPGFGDTRPIDGDTSR